MQTTKTNTQKNHKIDFDSQFSLSKFYLIIILALFCPQIIIGQNFKKIKVINGTTLEPIEGLYCYIIKNEDVKVDIEKTNKKGVFKAYLGIREDSTTYQIQISSQRYKPVREYLNTSSRKKIVISVFPDLQYIENDPNHIRNECSTLYFTNYQPKAFNDLSDLPDSIRAKLTAHLMERIGEEYYSKLKISGGQILDLNRLYAVNENAKNYQWTPYNYYLCFSFQEASKGIGFYTAKIILDKSGNVIEEIELPNIQESPEKAYLISLEEATQIATMNNFYREDTEISLSYHKKADSITWCFTYTDFNSDHTLSGWTLVVDAHNGKIIEKYSHGGIWD
jgi:hypothetical protein